MSPFELLGLPLTDQVYAYDAYGNRLDANNALTVVLHNGELWNAPTGDYYNRARYYNPVTGRFGRVDPFSGVMSDPQSLHKYLFAHGDPVNGMDPTGLLNLTELQVSMKELTKKFAANAKSVGRSAIRMYKAIVKISIQLNLAVGMADPQTRLVTTLATPYNLAQLRKFDRISSKSWNPIVVKRIARIVKTFGKTALTQLGEVQNAYNIPIKPNGFPDFGRYLARTARSRVFVPLTGTRYKDEKLADTAAIFTINANARKLYTWHHHEIMGVMELVRKDVHFLFRHDGGAMYYTITNNVIEYK